MDNRGSATTAKMPVTTITAMSSINVKPRCRLRGNGSMSTISIVLFKLKKDSTRIATTEAAIRQAAICLQRHCHPLHPAGIRLLLCEILSMTFSLSGFIEYSILYCTTSQSDARHAGYLQDRDLRISALHSDHIQTDPATVGRVFASVIKPPKGLNLVNIPESGGFQEIRQ